MKLFGSIISYALKHKIQSVIVIILAGFGISFFVPKPSKAIETVKVSRQKITESINASGTVNSATTVNLSFLAGGRVVYVGAKKGDEVKAGQTIAVLDQRTLRANLEQSVRDFWKQKNAFDTTQDANQNRKPNQALNDAMKRVLENNQYDLDKVSSSVELQNLALEQSVLSAPISGIVTRADIEVPGLTATAATMYTIADPNKLVFSIEVDEADIGKISLGQRVSVTLDAFPGHTFPLEVTKIDFSSHASSTGGTVYTVEAAMADNSDYRYRIGMNGDAEIIIAEKGKALSIPISSMIDEKHVYVKNGKLFEKRTIRTGLQSDTTIEVVSGLKEEEEIALQPEEVEKQVKK